MSNHARRASDEVWWRHLWIVVKRAIERFYAGRENRYRDVWLVIISGLVLWVAVTALDASTDAKTAGGQARTAAHSARDAARKANDNVLAIQRSREQVTRENCQTQNDRNTNTTLRLRMLVEQIKDPVQQEQARANIKSTLSLINALVPRRDCQKVVEQLSTDSNRP